MNADTVDAGVVAVASARSFSATGLVAVAANMLGDADVSLLSGGCLYFVLATFEFL